jgi:hypothetical protein
MHSYEPCTKIYLSILLISHKNFGGAEEDRTPDPLLAKQMLSQLSYSPKSIF